MDLGLGPDATGRAPHAGEFGQDKVAVILQHGLDFTGQFQMVEEFGQRFKATLQTLTPPLADSYAGTMGIVSKGPSWRNATDIRT
ncbi:hypothetical protein D8B25_20200 [Verminephrobacter aporrectodeae subsp. tuberculatae]|nr:hypothetical protein [Verminephrobacter aporrectodeae subsp. tuberculatae]MCW8205045.1 hypothetical protein [Verminephrobacter aporrectodeae subsp. tuberculatae]